MYKFKVKDFQKFQGASRGKLCYFALFLLTFSTNSHHRLDISVFFFFFFLINFIGILLSYKSNKREVTRTKKKKKKLPKGSNERDVSTHARKLLPVG